MSTWTTKVGLQELMLNLSTPRVTLILDLQSRETLPPLHGYSTQSIVPSCTELGYLLEFLRG